MDTPKVKDFKHAGYVFKIPKWTMSKKIEHENLILPLLRSIVSFLMVFYSSDEDDVQEADMMNAIFEGIASGLEESDVQTLLPVLLNGIYFGQEGETPELFSIDAAEKNEFDIWDLHIIAAAVLKVNFGTFLKKGSADSLGETIQSLVDL